MDLSQTDTAIPQQPALFLEPEAQSYLREAGKWSSFLGIIGFVGCGIMLILSLTIGSVMSRMAPVGEGSTSITFAGLSGFLTVFYILFAVLYFFFSLYLYQFGSRIKKGVLFSDNEVITNALGKLKSFFKLWGVLTIVFICIYTSVIIVSITIGIGAATLLRH